MLSGAEVDATMAYAQAEKAAATRKAYASDWRDFSRWCGARLAATLPAHPGIVASYLSDLAQQGCKASTIGRRAATTTSWPATSLRRVLRRSRSCYAGSGAPSARRGQGRRLRPRTC